MSSRAPAGGLQHKTAHPATPNSAMAEQSDAPLTSHASPVRPAQSAIKPTRLAVPKPLYSQVRDALLTRIRGGEWGVGDTLPNEFLLATAFGVSIGTIRRAIEGLEETGIVKRIQGRGTFVSGRGQTALEDKFCRLRRLDREPIEFAYALHRITVRAAAPSESALLGAGEPGEVIEILQHAYVAGEAIGVERSLLWKAALPNFETQFTGGQHIYQALTDYGVLVTRGEEHVCAIISQDGDETLRGLSVPAGTPLLSVVRIAFALEKSPVEYRTSRYRFDTVPGLYYDCVVC